MDWQFSSYIAILFLNLLLSLIVAHFTLRLRDKPGGLPLGLLMLAVAEWSFALIFEATAATIPAKVFWSKIEYLGITSSPVFLLLFALEFTHREKWLQRRYLTCYWIIPIISLALSFTNEWHHLIWTSFTPVPGSNFIIYGHGSWFWVMVAYDYLILSTAITLLLRAAFRLRHIYRRQAIMLLVGMFPPWLANILYVTNLGPIPGCDLSPIGFALTGLLLTWSLARLKLLDLVPVARDKVIESMRDGVLVLDAQNRIVGINPAAQELIGVDGESAIGRRAEEIFARWTGFEDRYRDAVEAQGQIFVDGVGHIEWRTSPLYEGERHSGQLIILRDITARKRAEEALRKSEERLRAIVESAQDAIFTKDREGHYIHANTACTSLFELTLDEMRGKTDFDLFPPQIARHIQEIDRAVIGKGETIVIEDMKPTAGVMRTFHISKVPLRDVNGEIVGLCGIARDITERKRAENALRESEEQLRNLIDAMPDFVCFKDGEGRWLVINDTSSQLFRLENVDYRGKKDSELAQASSILQGTFLTCQETDARTWEKRRLTRGEEMIPHPDGTTRTYDVIKVPVFHPDGRRKGLVVLGRDITERKRAEEALWKSEEKHRLFFENATIGIIHYNNKGIITDVNDAIIATFGSSRDKLVGLDIDDIPDKEFSKQVYKTLDGEHGCYEGLYTSYTGEKRAYIKADWIPIIDDGKVVGGVGIVEDITERKRLEREIEERRSYLESVLACAPDAIVTLDGQHRILEWNQGAEILFGYTPQEAAGRNIDDLITGTDANVIDEASGLTQRVLAGGSVSPTEMIRYRKDGSPVNVIASGSPILVENKVVGVVAVYTDITERKRMEQQLQQQERLAAVGQLAAGIAHDFNNLLATIMLYAQMSLRQPDLSPKIAHSFETILDESRQAAELVQQILDFSRHAMLKIQPLDLGSFAGKVVDILRRTIPENIHLVLEIGPEDYIIEADPIRIQQALMNLATNGRDAMPKGGELRFELSRTRLKPGDEPPVAGMSPGEWVCLAVSDTGTGITEEVRSHIFEPFFTTKEVGKGTGLGLAQVYGIIRQHEGYIGVETEIGKGTTFRIYLPASEAEEKVAEEESTAPPQGQGETILLVEDNENLLKVGRAILESLNYCVLTAANGREALVVYEAEGRVDLVLTDLVMPEMGGRQLMQKLKQMNSGLKGLAITGYALRKASQELEETGFLDIVHKPFDASTLAQIVRRALDAD